MPVKKNRNAKALRKIKNQHLCNTNLQALLRLKNTQHHNLSPEELDLMVIDLTLKELYNNGDKVVIDFKKDVLEKHDISFNGHTIERYWDILDATNLVNPVVGFGNTNKLSLGSTGYKLMLQFGGYKEYVQAMMRTGDLQSSTAQPVQSQGQTIQPEIPNKNPGESVDPYYEEGN